MKDSQERLRRIGATVRDRFESQKRVLSMEEFLELFMANPWRYSRDAARYLKDCFDHFGSAELDEPVGKVRRWGLFDLEFERERSREQETGREYLVGQESLQADFYRILSNFVREGRTNRLILLHGPNGSAKSTFVNCLMKALEHYSNTDEGAQYRFSWVFPRGSDGKTIGFGSRDKPAGPGESYAHLSDDQIDVKLVSELRENPLLLLPIDERRRLIHEAYEAKDLRDPPPYAMLDGRMGHKNRQIFEALLTAYRGDLARVLAHVRVERFYHSRRYRTGVVTIGPQMAVDAQERQISVDRSLAILPASLSALTLYETVGELVDASGGLLEFSDLLKRPLEAWRYLLLAIETGEVSLQFSMLPLNAVLVATSNELHLSAFKEHHEYRSFRGRLQLVRAPYLLDYTKEQEIYDAQIVPQVRNHVAPHATYVAALWAVLTRLRRPQAEEYEDKRLGELAAQLTAVEKAELYGEGKVPERFSADDQVELRTGLQIVRHESDTWPNYEGLTGASPREIRNLLLDADQDPRFSCLSPLALLEHIEAFCDSNDYEFLKEKPEAGFHDHRGFVKVVHSRWLERVDEEFREGTGLVAENQYLELFSKYVTHVSFWVKGERVYNEMTADYEDPDESLMNNVESMLDLEPGVREDFRRDLISTVAGHALDNPGQPVNYVRAFPRYLGKLREATYASRRGQLATIASDLLALLGDEEEARRTLDGDRLRTAAETRDTLFQKHGYRDSSLRDAVGELMRERYSKPANGTGTSG